MHCLKKIDSFARYEGEEIEFVGLTHSGGDLEHKLAQLKKKVWTPSIYPVVRDPRTLIMRQLHGVVPRILM